MYGRFVIDNFRGVEHIALDRMAPVNLLVGDNGSAKTTVLEALWIHAAPSMAGALDAPNRVRVLPPYVAAPWTWLFFNGQTDRPVRLQGTAGDRTWTFTLEEGEVEGPMIVAPPGLPDLSSPPGALQTLAPSVATRAITGRVQEGDNVVRVATARVTPLGMAINDFSPHPGWINATFDSPVGRLVQSVAHLYSDAVVRHRDEAVIAVVNTLDPDIRGLSVLASPLGAEVAAEFLDGRRVPVKLVGGGAQAILWYACESALADPGTVLLIDEIENGIHHSKLEPMWRSLGRLWQSSGIQAVVTTHSRECLEAALYTFGEDEILVHRFARVNGGINAVTYTRDMALTSLHSDMELQ